MKKTIFFAVLVLCISFGMQANEKTTALEKNKLESQKLNKADLGPEKIIVIQESESLIQLNDCPCKSKNTLTKGLSFFSKAEAELKTAVSLSLGNPLRFSIVDSSPSNGADYCVYYYTFNLTLGWLPSGGYCSWGGDLISF